MTSYRVEYTTGLTEEPVNTVVSAPEDAGRGQIREKVADIEDLPEEDVGVFAFEQLEGVGMNPLLDRDPDVHSGDLCLSGTRLPIYQLWDYLKHGYTVEEYCELFKVPEEKVRPVAEFLRA